MATSRLIATPAGKRDILQNGMGTQAHVRLFMGSFAPTAALATRADFSDECVHAQYTPVDVTLSYDTLNGTVRVVPTDANFNNGNPTTIAAKYAAIFRGAAAASSPSTPVWFWCDAAVNQLTDASASNASNAVITKNAHGWNDADVAVVAKCDANPDLVGRFFPVANTTTNTFVLTGLDLSAAAGATAMDLIRGNDTTEDSASADIARLVAARLMRW